MSDTEKLTADREAECSHDWEQRDVLLDSKLGFDTFSKCKKCSLIREQQASQAPGPLPTREEIARELCEQFASVATHTSHWEELSEIDRMGWLAEADYVHALLTQHAHAAPVPLQVTDHDVWDACMTWRHDFGLLAPNDEDRKNLEYDMRKILTQYVERVTKRSPEPSALASGEKLEPARVPASHEALQAQLDRHEHGLLALFHYLSTSRSEEAAEALSRALGLTLQQAAAYALGELDGKETP